MSFVSFVPKTTLLSGNFGYYNPKKAGRPRVTSSTSAHLPPSSSASPSSSRPKLRKPKKSTCDTQAADVIRVITSALSQAVGGHLQPNIDEDEEMTFTESMLFSPTRDVDGSSSGSPHHSTSASRASNHSPSTSSSTNSSPLPHAKPTIQSEEFDLVAVDLQVREYLSSKITQLSQLQHDLLITLDILSSNTSDISQKVLAKERSDLLRRTIKDLESTMEYALYDYRTSTILEEYTQIANATKNRSFLVNKTKADVECERRMQELRNTYIGVCRQHLDVRIQKKKVHRSLVCNSCGCPNMKVNIDDDSLYVCEMCYAEVEILIDAPSFKDTDRVNLSSKYTYTRKGHFIDAGKRIQGTHNVDSKEIEKALAIIRAEMAHHNLVAEQGLPNSVTKDNVHTFLTEQSLSAHYEDLPLLYNMITGVPCIDISEYMDDLLNDFELLEEALEKIKDESRVNSLNVYFKLCALLQRRGFKCKKSDFYILKTKAKEDEHNDKLEQAYALLGWEWKPIT